MFKPFKFSLALCLGLVIFLSWENLILPSPAMANFSSLCNSSLRSLRLCGSISSNFNSSQLLQQGKTLYEGEQFAEAIKIWREAERNFAAQKDTLSQSLTLSFLSLAYQKLGDRQSAQSTIDQSLNLLQTIPDSNPEKNQVLATVLNTKGRWQQSLGQTEEALLTLQKATAAYQKAGDEQGRIGSLINQAQTLQSLGFYQRSAKILTQLQQNIQQQTNPQLKLKGLLSLSSILRTNGDLETSQELGKQALEVAEKLASPSALTTALINLGNTELALARRVEAVAEDTADNQQVQQRKLAALTYYQKATNTANSGNQKLQAQVNQMRLLLETKQWREAESLWREIQSELAQTPTSRSKVFAQINLANSLLKSPNSNWEFIQPQSIGKLLANAVQEAKSLADKRAESYSLGVLGELYEKTGQFRDAEQLTKQALQQANSINATDISYLWEWQLGRLYKVQKNWENAIASYTTAINTLKSLRSDLVNINPEVQFTFRDSVEPVYRELVDLLLQPFTPPSVPPVDGGERGGVTQTKLIQARLVIESLQLAELDNFFREACLDAKPEQIEKLDVKAAIIYPVILPDRLEIIVSLPQKPLKNYKISISQNQVESTINQLEQALAIRHSNQEERLQISQQVYDWLIRPMKADLQASGVQTLVFISDGSLRNIPMAALHDGQQYLLEKYNIALTPGLQLLRTQPLNRERLRALTGGLSEEREGFSALPGVRMELQQINAEVPGITLLNQDFTSRSLSRQVAELPFPVVHLATHGQFSSNFKQTFILAWDGPINVKQLDDLLRNRNPNLPSEIELLVLSACETATGDSRAALGLAGVAVRAGARSTLATLWKVSDESTAVLMSEFYRELATPGTTKAEALRLAQISLLNNRRYRNPYFWAPYVLVGNWL
ncbi:CHAT domain-containing protein [Floridanema aerugineum]|uniref:CHAT domain-containing protein n=1 Tax=Floridaenema aerugineum BLCC-F46 TaxID=3153654 RepID=A0ABV4X8K4_9CYAN